MFILFRAKYLKRKANEYLKEGYILAKKLKFDKANEMLWEAVILFYDCKCMKEATYAMFLMYSVSYAKICKHILEEDWNLALKVLEHNKVSWENALEKFPEIEEYSKYFNVIIETIEKSIHRRSVDAITQLIFDENYFYNYYADIINIVDSKLKSQSLDQIAIRELDIDISLKGLENLCLLIIKARTSKRTKTTKVRVRKKTMRTPYRLQFKREETIDKRLKMIFSTLESKKRH